MLDTKYLPGEILAPDAPVFIFKYVRDAPWIALLVSELPERAIAIPEDTVIAAYPNAASFILVQVIDLIDGKAMPLIEAVAIRLLCENRSAEQYEQNDAKSL